MNRRSFITKALAGLAAVPLIGRLVQARPINPEALSGDYIVTRGPFDLESVYVDGRKVFDRKCNERRRKLVWHLERDRTVYLPPEAFANTFSDFDHQAIEWWAEEHGLNIHARPDGLIRVARQLSEFVSSSTTV